jgi:uncharacterized protein YjeT (DUF2065 family)
MNRFFKVLDRNAVTIGLLLILFGMGGMLVIETNKRMAAEIAAQAAHERELMTDKAYNAVLAN